MVLPFYHILRIDRCSYLVWLVQFDLLTVLVTTLNQLKPCTHHECPAFSASKTNYLTGVQRQVFNRLLQTQRASLELRDCILFYPQVATEDCSLLVHLSMCITARLILN